MNGTNGTTNGVHPGAAEVGGLTGSFDFGRARRLLELAEAEGERQLADARTVRDQADTIIRRREGELRLLRRALDVLQEDPCAGAPAAAPRRGRAGTDPADGVGKRAGVFLLAVLRERFETSGLATCPTRTLLLAAKGWPQTTTRDGIRRLEADGLIRRAGRSGYELTAAGLAAPPPAPGTLPLLAPRPDESAETAEEATA